jgi:release factor glutamine methyltransferase
MPPPDCVAVPVRHRTVRESIDEAVRVLEAAGHRRDGARIDADVLTRHLLDWDRATMLLRCDEPMPPAAGDRLDALIARRAAREPVAYLTGVREFYGRAFAVSPAVLIPRPETELVVDAVLKRMAPDSTARVVDVGTGSGVLAVSLAAERRHVRVDATDISEDALAVARQNAATHGVEGRIHFHCGDLLAPLPGPFDVIVANPPYVPLRHAAGLSPDVGRYEPPVSLFGGDNGLDLVTRLLREAVARLAPGGWLAMEFGMGQEYDVAELATASGLVIDEVLPDLQGIARVIVCRPRP